jgi:hypothetical protein
MEVASEHSQRNAIMDEELVVLDMPPNEAPLEEEASNSNENDIGSHNINLAAPVAWRKTRCEVLWLTIVNLALIWALIMDAKQECSNHHLETWIYVMVPLQFLLMVPREVVKSYLPVHYQNSDRASGFIHLGARLLHAFWLSWAITGIIWTFQAKKCSEQTPSIYVICYILAIMNTILIGFPVVFCLCSAPATIFVYICCPNVLGIKKIRKASPRLIKKVTKSKKFDESLGIPKEDANCAICLSDYEKDEEIRFLRCNHHFHSECIMEWLVKNMSCPFCKQEIDKTEETTKDNQKQPAQIESDDDEEPLDRATLLV